MKKDQIKFSVIIPVYFGDKASFFRKAINSIINQTLPPDEVIISIDGPISEDLREEIKDIKANKIFSILDQKINKGVGVARKEAIKIAKYDVIALMDSDDISLESRFEKQLKIISEAKAEVVGSWIEEFENIPNDLGSIRKLPTTHDEIYEFGKFRMPVNNVTLMFTKKAYVRVGGYSEQRNSEDWNLIARMLAKGIIFHNIPEVLVYARAGESMVTRRRSYSHFINELKVFPEMYSLKYINLFHLIANILIRVLLRVLPQKLTSLTYRKILR